MNQAVRPEVNRRDRHQPLAAWPDELEKIEGSVDESLVTAFEEMLT